MNPEVSVICIAYNQRDYICRCLDSIFGQVTDFPYEVIVHDDASTDGTAEIIRSYSKKYPDKLIPILEKENQFKLGKNITQLTSRYARGKYIALCECDDWWTDSSKLQIQFNYMEKRPDCALCTHSVTCYDGNNGNIIGEFRASESDRDFDTNEVILGGGGLFGTNSMFYRSDFRELPEEFLNWGVGDYPTTIYLSLCGNVHYINQSLSAYRFCAKGSWSEKYQDKDIAIDSNILLISGLRRIQKVYFGQFDDAIEQIIMETKVNNAVLNKDIKAVFLGDLRDYFRSLGSVSKLKLCLRFFFPSFYKFLSNRI